MVTGAVGLASFSHVSSPSNFETTLAEDSIMLQQSRKTLKNSASSRLYFVCLLAMVLFALPAKPLSAADDQLRLRDICRLKGHEENTLQGLGLVVGLRGTGDKDVNPTTRALARMMQLMGSGIATDIQGIAQLRELKDASNVALVFVTADVPPSGAQQGDTVDCTISAISAKSLEGGTLMLTPLLGPRVDRPVVYALAQGQITVPNPNTPTSATIYNGCKMEATIENQFVANDKITLILDQSVSSFTTAQSIEDEINSFNQNLTGYTPQDHPRGSEYVTIAEAKDPVHVEVMVPRYYRETPVKFVSLIMDLPLPYLRNKKRVVINEREGVVVIGEDVMIAPVAITHKSLVIETRYGTGNGFAPVDIENPSEVRPKLKNLVEALNKLKVPTEDVIAIIKALKRKGDLYGEVVLQ